MKRKNYRKAEEGQAIVEYALIIVGISLVAILILNLMGVSIQEVFCQVADALGSQACANLSCAFTFDDASDLDGWVGGDVGKTLQVEDGYLCNTKNKYNSFSGCSEDMNKSDFTVNLSGINVTKTGNNHAGIDFMFRTDEMGDGYRFAYNTKKDWVTFWKRMDSKWIKLERVSIPSEWGSQEVDFQIEAEGDTLTVYKDGEVVMQTTDDTFTEGDFAWRNKPGSKSCVDEISFE